MCKKWIFSLILRLNERTEWLRISLNRLNCGNIKRRIIYLSVSFVARSEVSKSKNRRVQINCPQPHWSKGSAARACPQPCMSCFWQNEALFDLWHQLSCHPDTAAAVWRAVSPGESLEITAASCSVWTECEEHRWYSNSCIYK